MGESGVVIPSGEHVKVCGRCVHHDPARRICLLHMSYAAFVYTDSEAKDCPSYQTKGIYEAPKGKL